MKKLVLLLIVALIALTSCSSGGAAGSKKYSVGSYSITSPIADRNKVNGEKVQMNTTFATVLMADGKVVNVSADENVITDNKVDISKVSAIAFDPYTHGYYKITERVGDAFKDGFKLK